MNEKINFKNKIMARIYAVYILRKITSMSSLSILVALMAVGYIGVAVSLRDVFNNMPSSVSGEAQFFTSAFINTELAVQCALIAIILALAIYVTRMVGDGMHIRSGQAI